MSDPHGKDTLRTIDIQPSKPEQERRSQARAQGVLAKIEDATYAILRKHEKNQPDSRSHWRELVS